MYRLKGIGGWWWWRTQFPCHPVQVILGSETAGRDYYTSHTIKVQNSTNLSWRCMTTMSWQFKSVVRVATAKSKNSARHLTTGNTEDRRGCLSWVKMGVPTWADAVYASAFTRSFVTRSSAPLTMIRRAAPPAGGNALSLWWALVSHHKWCQWNVIQTKKKPSIITAVTE